MLPVQYPVVPVGQSRLRITLHAENTVTQVTRLVEEIFKWVEEIIDIEEGRSAYRVTGAAREIYSWMEMEGLTGYGMV